MNRKQMIELHEQAVATLDNWRGARRRRQDTEGNLIRVCNMTPKDRFESWALFMPPTWVLEDRLEIQRKAEAYWERRYFRIMDKLNVALFSYKNDLAAEKMTEGI